MIVPVIPEKKTKKDEKVVQSKDTKKEMRKETKKTRIRWLGEDAKLPDKQLCTTRRWRRPSMATSMWLGWICRRC